KRFSDNQFAGIPHRLHRAADSNPTPRNQSGFPTTNLPESPIASTAPRLPPPQHINEMALA
ncbi:MAG: hypothetical protein MUD05_05625, partial [Candidatus Nanopelagicales bacterium]|nr:hypothetical protein [Candidatus Nanopelagicales bacterium]